MSYYRMKIRKRGLRELQYNLLWIWGESWCVGTAQKSVCKGVYFPASRWISSLDALSQSNFRFFSYKSLPQRTICLHAFLGHIGTPQNRLSWSLLEFAVKMEATTRYRTEWHRSQCRPARRFPVALDCCAVKLEPNRLLLCLRHQCQVKRIHTSRQKATVHFTALLKSRSILSLCQALLDRLALLDRRPSSSFPPRYPW